METVQLLSDAVKIGFPVLGTVLGAVIGALSTYFLTKQSHKNQVEKDLREWRLNLITQIASDVTEFEHVAGLYIASLANKQRGIEAGNSSYEECRQQVSNQSKALRKARANLKMIGLLHEDRLLEEYVALVRESHGKGTNLKRERATELVELISPGPIKFYEALSSHIPTT
ncbi:MAG: hypothetical protein AB1642_00340 [Pseudomonadota bacterium]